MREASNRGRVTVGIYKINLMPRSRAQEAGALFEITIDLKILFLYQTLRPWNQKLSF